MILTLEISPREDGGLRIRCQEYPEIYISGSSPDDVFADIGPVMQRLLADNHGADWLRPRDNEFDTAEPGPSREPTGLWDGLTEEQRQAALSYDGPVRSGKRDDA